MLEFYPNINSGLMQGQCETVLQTSLNCNGRTGNKSDLICFFSSILYLCKINQFKG